MSKVREMKGINGQNKIGGRKFCVISVVDCMVDFLKWKVSIFKKHAKKKEFLFLINVRSMKYLHCIFAKICLELV